MRNRWDRSLFRLPAARLAALSLLWLGADQQLWGQGCAMCRTSLAGQNDAIIASLGLGVIILLIPPLTIVSAILYAAFKRGG